MSMAQEVLGTQPARQSGQVYWAVHGNHGKQLILSPNGHFSADHFINKVSITIITDVFLSGRREEFIEKRSLYSLLSAFEGKARRNFLSALKCPSWKRFVNPCSKPSQAICAHIRPQTILWLLSIYPSIKVICLPTPCRQRCPDEKGSHLVHLWAWEWEKVRGRERKSRLNLRWEGVMEEGSLRLGNLWDVRSNLLPVSAD